MIQALNFIKRFVAVALVVLGLTLIAQNPSYAGGIPQGDWTLTSLNGQPALEETQITIKFDSDDESSGKVSGSGGCNLYFAGYSTREPGQIQIGPIGSTFRGCQDPIIEQEAKYFRALGSVQNYEVGDSTLSLTNSEDTKLVFSAVPQ